MSEQIIVVRERDLYDYETNPSAWVWTLLIVFFIVFGTAYCLWMDSSPAPPSRVLRYKLIDDDSAGERPRESP